MANFDWLRRKRRDTPEPELPPPAAANIPAEEDDPTRCPKRWMGKRCALRVGHAGICQWPA